VRAVSYDETFDPPAPVLPLRLRIPDPSGWLRLVGLVDTGADITVIPSDVAERYFPVGGAVGIRGVTGVVQEAILYRVEIEFGGLRRTLLLAGFGSEVIVGRDSLNRLNINLEGPSRMLRLAPITNLR